MREFLQKKNVKKHQKFKGRYGNVFKDYFQLEVKASIEPLMSRDKLNVSV